MPTIHLLMPLTWSYSRRLLRGVRAFAAERRDWHLVWLPNAGLLGSRMRLHGPPDGIIAMVRANAEMRLLKRWDLPCVNVSGRFAQSALPRVIADDEAIGRLAAQHLLQSGYRDFIFIGEPDEHFAEQRRAGFAATVGACGHRCRVLRLDQLIDGRFARDLRRPCGIMLYLDDLGPEAVAACRDAGLRLPEDVGIIGVNDDEVFCELSEVPLSSVDPGMEQIGYRAAAMLGRLIDGEALALPEELLPPVSVIGRASTRREAVADPLLGAALAHIAAHACEPLRVGALVAAVGCARRSLELRFRQHFGHTIHEEIQRHRFAEARRLLRETGLDIAAVAGSCGFASATRFGAQFRERHGLPPAAWRRGQR